ncbi:hypothetical protein NE237_025756 [Protea cynaroides]|uniref:Uncharacterized protein n=1 Tax=Protea cynaroides TaxID=273540 RepID=A0A9Q0H5S3_9MAGN|nr:hypothetical protein NE237_025756 [Protea cynaroides]
MEGDGSNKKIRSIHDVPPEILASQKIVSIVELQLMGGKEMLPSRSMEKTPKGLTPQEVVDKASELADRPFVLDFVLNQADLVLSKQLIARIMVKEACLPRDVKIVASLLVVELIEKGYSFLAQGSRDHLQGLGEGGTEDDLKVGDPQGDPKKGKVQVVDRRQKKAEEALAKAEEKAKATERASLVEEDLNQL